MPKKNKRKFYVYILRRPDNHDPFYVWLSQPFYIGKGFDKRIIQHRDYTIKYLKSGNECYVENLRKTNIIIYLWKNLIDFEEEILFDNLTEQEAFEIENKMILFYGRENNGTGILANMTDGGEGCSGYKHTEEDRKRMSEIQKQLDNKGENNSNFAHYWDEERRQNLSKKQSGENHPWYGRKHTKEETEKTSRIAREKAITNGKVEAWQYEPRPCEHCGIVYEPKSANEAKKKRFCSKECFDLFRHKNVKDRICPSCGNSFKPRSNSQKQTFCSIECRKEVHKNRPFGNTTKNKGNVKKYEPRPCKECGTIFQPSIDDKKFCCKKCYDLNRSKNKKSRYESQVIKNRYKPNINQGL
jgi:hypothetical protein